MIAFEVKDMTCGHCVGAVTRAVAAVDPRATVEVDLASKRVQIDTAAADALSLFRALADAGYAATPVPSRAAAPAKAKAAGGCGCGCG